MAITFLDGILLVVMLISGLLAMIRGFVREVLSIAAWIVAAVAAYYLYRQVLPYVEPHISHRQLAIGVSAGIVFIVTLIVVSFITMRISDFVLDSRIGPLDRTAGFLFGAARGLLLVVVGMLFFNWFVHDEASQPSWISEAKSRPILNAIGAELMAALPENPEKKILDQFQNPVFDGDAADSSSDTGADTGADGDGSDFRTGGQGTDQGNIDSLLQSQAPAQSKTKP